jgi:predicted alpha-1,2-mannosidase
MKPKNLLFNSIVFISALLILNSCGEKQPETPFEYVDTFIGTGGHGHTFPGATLPFGMVQLSPDTRKDSWDGCSGYHYSDSIIYGFSHTHLSGTGVGDYGDIRFFPNVGEIKTDAIYGKDYKNGYGSKFNHKMETSEPGYYAVYLEDPDVFVSLTATDRCGFHKYMFPKSEQSQIVLDLVESVVSEKIIESGLNIVNDSTVSGFRRTKAWANDQYIYFYASFSKPFNSWGISDDGNKTENKTKAVGDSLKAWFNFNTSAKETVLLKVGVSNVDIAGAKNNLEKEVPHWDFKKTRQQAKEVWEKELGKIDVLGGSLDQRKIFYTALYHSFVAPNQASDIDNRYRAHDKKIYKNPNLKSHTVFSLWDTFRALHPLFTIVQREKTVELINSMLEMYSHDNLLPVWELAACETNCMIGYNAVPVITDAYAKGITNFDSKTAIEAMKASANSGLYGLEWYTTKGYIPADKEGESVSKTLEYAYDDWCIAEMAKLNGDQKTYNEFIKRAQYYKNIFDKHTGFFRGKSNGRFVSPFNPTEVNFMLTEANTWQYNFFVPQDINTHIDMLGGDVNYEAKLDSLFNTKMELSGRHQSDITGLIGQYAHGNEPSHHMAYLYNYVGKPWKTQKIVRQIVDELYTINPDGLSGNEDCGQMSAWYVLSSMGFYPVTPGTDKYIIGSPVFDNTSIKLENGKTFKIISLNNSSENIYIQSVTFNGTKWTKSFITNQMIMNGGELIFEMGNTPNKSWANKNEDRPHQQISKNLITPTPYFNYESKTFEKQSTIKIGRIGNNEDLQFRIQKKYGRKKFNKYEKPITIKKTTEVIAVAEKNGIKSFEENTQLVKIPAGRKIKLKTEYNSQYAAGGDIALINMLRGGSDFKTGNWQGYYGVNIEAGIDLGEVLKIKELGMGFLQDENSWIFMPEYVKFEISEDGKNFTKLNQINNTIDIKKTGGITKDFQIKLKKKTKVRYIRAFAKNRGNCPDWHKGAGNKSWIFADEVWVK